MSLSAPLLTRHQVAALLAISVSGLDKLIRSDPVFPKPIRFGRSVRLRAEDIETYITSQAGSVEPKDLASESDTR